MNKKRVSMVLVMVLLVSLLSGSLLPARDAAAADIWIPISTPGELSAMSSNLSGNYMLMQDIDLADFDNGDHQGWDPIGVYLSDPFKGKFDGNGHTIRNLTINRPDQNYVGLFGYADGAMISNLRLDNAMISGHSYVGGIAGQMTASTLSNSSVQGTITGNRSTGGLVGYSGQNTLADNYAEGTMLLGSSPGGNFGGLVGYSTGNGIAGTVSRSYSTATVPSGPASGGLIGFNGNTAILSSYWDTQTSGKSDSAGGTGKTTAEMKRKATYAEWDFTTTWGIIEESTYPLHRNDYLNVALASLTVKDAGDNSTLPLDRAFASDYGVYSLQVVNKTGQIVVAGTPVTGTSSVSVDGGADSKTLTLSTGKNEFQIKVTATDGSYAEYKLTVYRDAGTNQYPHRITTATQLSKIGDPAEGYGMSQVYRLDADLDLSSFISGTGWSPIGTSSNPFAGVLDGNDHTVSHMTVNAPMSDHVGLFGYANGATLKNIALIDAHITGNEKVGGLIGAAENVNVSATAVQGAVHGSKHAGGLVGSGDNMTVSGAAMQGAVYGNENVGGLIGELLQSGSSVSESYSAALVSGDILTGGLIGFNNGGDVSNSFWDTDSSRQSNSNGGTGKTTSQMMTKATYTGAGWLFGSGHRWGIIDGTTYPMPNTALDSVSLNGLTVTAPGASVSMGSFDKNNGIYSAALSTPVARATVAATAAATGATVTVNESAGSNIALTLGNNPVDIRVKSPDGLWQGLYRLTIIVPTPQPKSVQLPANGFYGIGQQLDFTVTYDKPVDVAGTPTIPLYVGTTVKAAQYIGKPPGEPAKLLFRYTVQAGDKDMDGIALGSEITTAAPAAITALGSNVPLTLSGIIPSTSNILINGVVPSIVLTPSTTAPTNGPVTISVTSDGTILKWAAGTHAASYFTSAGTAIASGGSFLASSNGSYTVYAKDDVGNATVQIITVSNIITQNPAILLDYSPKRLVHSGVNVSVNASVYEEDKGNTLAVLKWANGIRTVSDFANPAFGTDVLDSRSFHVIHNGTYTVYAADAAGNSKVESITISNIVTQLPALTLDYSPKGLVHSGVDVSVTASVYDGGTGNTLAALKWAPGQLTASSFTDPSFGTDLLGSRSFHAAQNGIYTVYAADAAGNSKVETITVSNIVTQLPALTLDYNPKSHVKSGVDVSVTASVYDAGTGNTLAALKWAPGQLTASSFADPSFGTDVLDSRSFHVTQNGIYTVYAADTAGNSKVETITVSNIVTQLPALTLDYSPKSLVHSGVDVSVNASVYDAGTGNTLAALKWAPGQLTASSFADPSFGTDVLDSRSFHVAQNGIYTVYAADTAGNSKVETITVSNIVTQLPILTLDYSPKDSDQPSVDVTVSASVYNADAGNTLTALKWAPGQLTASSFADPSFGTDLLGSRSFHVTKNGAYTVFAADSAGNQQVEFIEITNILNPTTPVDTTPTTNRRNPSSQSQYGIVPGQAYTLTIDGITLQIPVGAITEPMNITMRNATSEALQLLGPDQKLLSDAFAITKDVSGKFAIPVTLKVQWTSNQLGANQRPAIFYYDETVQQWVEIESKPDGSVVIGQTDHFTLFAVMPVHLAVETQQEKTFSDIAGHWAEAEIRESAALGWIDGYPDGTFLPDKPISRAEFAVMLNNVLHLPAGWELPFADKSDIPGWASPAIASAVRAGIVNGYSDRTFQPDVRIVRAEAAVMIAKAAGLKAEQAAKPTFSDDASIAVWAKAYIEAAYRAKLIQGQSGNLFNPQAPATRAEAVVLLKRLTAHLHPQADR
ncbi:S-layer homology domain-containing protein [Paenibacillus sp. NPDC056579]|uniref:S-layer homology domain-containing protein n=1 Tax=Paenibacillus sp. NPDC056579 TaxID=3345871 RepID=UPI003673E5B1